MLRLYISQASIICMILAFCALLFWLHPDESDTLSVPTMILKANETKVEPIIKAQQEVRSSNSLISIKASEVSVKSSDFFSENEYQKILKGIPSSKWPEFASSLSTSDLLNLFNNKTHIDHNWIIQNGISSANLKQLAQIWSSTDILPGTENMNGSIDLSNQSRNGRNRISVQDTFITEDRYIYGYYSVPADYPSDSVIVRWLDMDNRTIVHLDRDFLSASTLELQEVWMRPNEDWSPGRYRIEILAANSELTPIAATTFTVIK